MEMLKKLKSSFDYNKSSEEMIKKFSGKVTADSYEFNYEETNKSKKSSFFWKLGLGFVGVLGIGSFILSSYFKNYTATLTENKPSIIYKTQEPKIIYITLEKELEQGKKESTSSIDDLAKNVKDGVPEFIYGHQMRYFAPRNLRNKQKDAEKAKSEAAEKKYGMKKGKKIKLNFDKEQ